MHKVSKLGRGSAQRVGFTWIAAASLLVSVGRPGLQAASEEILYETGFEVAEGYSSADAGLSLIGQLGWTGEGSGGNGLVADFWEGFGQQAFVGFSPPAFKHESLSVWRPLSLPPLPSNTSVLKFSVWMQIVDSTAANGNYDDFRWSAYNTADQRLFSIDFDNERGEIFYALDDDAGFRPSGFVFSNDAIYLLEVFMNFARNDWLAVLNGVVVIDAQPITTTGARLDLSDVDAVWVLRTKGSAGDNYLLFDEYRVTLEPTKYIPPRLELLGFRPDGTFELLLHGERGLEYSIDVSEDFVNWSSLATYAPPEGWWQFVDDTAPDYPRSFYRARQVTP